MARDGRRAVGSAMRKWTPHRPECVASCSRYDSNVEAGPPGACTMGTGSPAAGSWRLTFSRIMPSLSARGGEGNSVWSLVIMRVSEALVKRVAGL